MYVPPVLTTKRRVLHEATFAAGCLLRAFGSGKPDVIFAVTPPLGLGVVASRLARWWRVPFIFDVEDLQPDAAIELGMMQKGRISDVLYAVEWDSYRRAALISTLTEGMRQRIADKGIDAGKIVLFPPRADASLYGLRQRVSPDRFRQRYGLEGKLIISHSGNMGVKQGLGVVLEAAEHSRERRDLCYLFVGDGAMRTQLEEQARLRGLENVRFLPLLNDDEFAEMLAATDVALVTQQKIVSDIVFPSKTVTLLSAGCPVIASVNAASEVASAVRRSSAGVVIEPERSDLLWQAIEEMVANPERLAAMSLEAEKFARQSWDESITLPRMEEHFLSVRGRS
jgi:colanic acid biosynthesis glycosyl transferase WcaI